MGLKQRRQVLSRFVGSKKEHETVRQVVPGADANAILLSELDSGRPPRNRPKPALVNAVAPTISGGCLRGHDNDVGLGSSQLERSRHEPHTLRGEVLRPVEKSQVVNRHDQRGRSRRDHTAGGMDDIYPPDPAGHRRTPKPVPCFVQGGARETEVLHWKVGQLIEDRRAAVTGGQADDVMSAPCPDRRKRTDSRGRGPSRDPVPT